MRKTLLSLTISLVICSHPHLIFAQNAVPTPTDQIEGRLSDLEAEIRKLRAEPLSTKEDRDAFLKQFSELREAVATDKLSLADHFFQILLGLLTIAALMGGLGALLIQRIVTDRALNSVAEAASNVETQLREVIDKQVRYAMSLTLAESLAQLAFTWWELYQPDFQDLMRDRSKRPDDFVIHKVKTAQQLAKDGVDLFLKSGLKEGIKDDLVALVTYAKLQNQCVYHSTVYFMCVARKGATTTEEQKNAVLEGADECQKFSRDERLKNSWYRLSDTAAFAMIQLGSEATQDRGRNILREIFGRQGDVKAPTVWLQKQFELYCPIDAKGKPTDPWNLGIVRPF